MSVARDYYKSVKQFLGKNTININISVQGVLHIKKTWRKSKFAKC